MKQRHELSFHMSRAKTVHQEYCLGAVTRGPSAQDKIVSKVYSKAPTTILTHILPDLKGTLGPFR